MRPGVAACPSANPDQLGASIFGVVEGSVHAPRVRYLRKARPADPEVLELCEPVTPAEVFRFSAPCVESHCRQFADGRCSLGERLVALGTPSVPRAPRCAIRRSCRWWAENGVEACLRCPSVVTVDVSPTDEARAVAGPAAEM